MVSKAQKFRLTKVEHDDAISGISKAELRAALDDAVLNMLRPATAALGLLLLVWAYSYLQRPQNIAHLLTTVALLTALLFLAFSAFFERMKIPSHFANPLATMVAGLLLFQRLLALALTLEVEQTTSLILLLVGSGFLILSTPWWIVVASLTVISWIGIALANARLPAWNTFALEMVSATTLAFIIHEARLHSFRRQEMLRRQNEQRNAELERRALQLETLITAGQNINAILDLDALLKYVVDLVQVRFGYDYVGIFRPDEIGAFMVSCAGTGKVGETLTQQAFQLPVGEKSLIGWVAQHRQLACVNDVTQDARYVRTDVAPDTCSELVLPLESAEMFLGVLDIQSDMCNAFAEDDIRVLASLADQVAIAIQNAASYEEEHARRLLTETLFEVGRTLSRTLDMREILDLILVDLAKLVHFDRGSVMLQRSDELEIVAAVGFPPESNPLQIRVPLHKDDVFGQIHHTKQSLVVAEVLARSDWQNVENLPQARSWVGLPFVNAEDEVIGMLSLTRETPDPFTEDQVDLATAFAGHAAFALQNAGLYTKLTQAYEQLERMDRTKSDFITIASHELRTPLTLLRGYSQILLRDASIRTNPTQSEIVQGIYQGAVRLHEIIDSMVDMAKIDSRALQLYIEPISLSSLVPGVAGQFVEALQERNLTLTLKSLDDLPIIKGDLDALKKVFLHLIVNAIKYTPDGGQISITGQALAAGEQGLPDGGVELVVSDTGIGIDADYHDLIFAKFYQTGEVAFHSSGKTKFKGGGPGLGLAIAKGVVQTHGGQIWVESPGYDEEACPGSHFHVILPLTPPSAVAEGS